MTEITTEAEITRLRAINAELVEALKVFANHFGPLKDNEMLHPEARRSFALARAAIAKAEKEGRTAALDELIKTDGELL